MAAGDPGFIYVRMNGFDFYTSGATAGVHFEFPQTVVRDLDVLNKTELEVKIKEFVDQNQIVPCSLVVLLSEPVYFEKDFVDMPPDQQEVAIDDFLENVPFENVAIRNFVFERGVKVVATNMELYRSIKDAFENKGFIVEAISPAFVVGVSLTGDQNSLSPESASAVFEKYAILKQNSFNANEKTVIEMPKHIEQKEKPAFTVNKRLIFLASVFIILAIVLIIVTINTLRS